MRKMYVNGRWVESESGAVTTVLDPATEDVLDDVPYADEVDVGRAVEAATRAFEE